MKKAYCLGAVVALALGATTAAHADVDISVAIQGEIAPGVYGRVDLNGRPPPPLVYAQPVVIEQPPPHVVYAPLYLHVPPEHARDWRLHCHEYHACDRQVYFVRSREYDPEYIRAKERERYEEQRRHEEEHERRDERHEERREERRDEHWEEHHRDRDDHHDHDDHHDDDRHDHD
jgi:hypothetical protein